MTAQTLHPAPTYQPYSPSLPHFSTYGTALTPVGPRIPLSARFHRPGRRRLRIIDFAGFPIPAFVPKCRCCGYTWPCREVIQTLRQAFGWTHKLDPLLLRLRRAVR